jgi:hypothetical protein
MNATAIISVICVFGLAPGIVFSFIYFMRKSRNKLDELRYHRDILELELEKERLHVKAVEAENARLDRLIEDSSRK